VEKLKKDWKGSRDNRRMDRGNVSANVGKVPSF
jgi:hypothetical protein